MIFWGQLGFQDHGSLVSEYLARFHDFTILILTLILVFVSFVILFIVKGAYIHKTLFAHHSLEFIWTFLPVLVLVAIAIPSLTLLFIIEDSSESFVSVKVIGSQWYWQYERGFLGAGGQATEIFDSYIIPEEIGKDSLFRLLDTTNYLRVPVNVPVRLLITSRDVLHSWTVPALGAKADACPGRLNEVVIVPYHVGTYYGQCSEICGRNHRFMPIELKVTDIQRRNFQLAV